jgi:hypothetical protein
MWPQVQATVRSQVLTDPFKLFNSSNDVSSNELRQLKSAFGSCRFHVLPVDLKGNAPTSLGSYV